MDTEEGVSHRRIEEPYIGIGRLPDYLLKVDLPFELVKPRVTNENRFRQHLFRQCFKSFCQVSIRQ